MQEIVEFNNPTEENLNKINEFIHDWFFDIDDVNFDPSAGILVIPFVRGFSEEEIKGTSLLDNLLLRTKVPYYKCCLKILNVIEYHITDTEQIGNYDFCSIEFDGLNTIDIITNATLSFKVVVNKFSILTMRENEMLGFKSKNLFDIFSVDSPKDLQSF